MKRLQLTGERAPVWHLHTQTNTCKRESLVLKHQNVSKQYSNCLQNKQLFLKKEKKENCIIYSLLHFYYNRIL